MILVGLLWAVLLIGWAAAFMIGWLLADIAWIPFAVAAGLVLAGVRGVRQLVRENRDALEDAHERD